MVMWTGAEARPHQPVSDLSCEKYSEAEIKIFFNTGSSKINLSLDDNRRAIMRMDSLLTNISNDSSWVVKKVTVKGSASPEGPVELNRTLSRKRADAISRHFAAYTDDSSIPTEFLFEGANWNGLRALVEATPGVPDSVDVVRIIGLDSSDRLARLKRLSGGTTYRWLLNNLFPKLRSSSVVIFSLHREEVPEAIKERVIATVDTTTRVYIEDDVVETTVVPVTAEPEVSPVPADDYVRRLYIKTNAIGWAMAITNIAFEIDVVPHLSVTLPLYYSAWEYGSHKVKFRTCAFQPELRLWNNPSNMGFFGGIHFGVAQYNVAVGGKYRFQDHNGHTPALGGGLSVGYRCTLGHSQRWMMEFTAGAGAYKLHYDVFDNSSVPHGMKLYERRKTFVGIDNVGVTFIYAIPLRKKGGRL